jgi:hypothetical protein
MFCDAAPLSRLIPTCAVSLLSNPQAFMDNGTHVNPALDSGWPSEILIPG